MKFKVDHFFLVFACFSLCGCTSPFVYYSESECLAKLCDSGYASYAGELGEPPTPEGTPINNPYVLIGRWSFSCETETISVGLNLTRHSPKGIPIDVQKDKVYRVWEFRADGTYSHKALNSGPYTASSTTEGTWNLSAGTLEIVQTKSPWPKSNGHKSYLKVFDCGKGEILITLYTPGSKAYRDLLENNQSYVKTANDRFKSMGKWACIIRCDVGFDKRGYLIEREFVQKKDGKGFMYIKHATPPQRYKYIGTPATTQSMALSGGQQQVAVQNVQNGGVSAISTASKSPYSLESFTWEDGSDYSAIFSVKMHGECSIDSFFAIRQAFDAHV